MDAVVELGSHLLTNDRSARSAVLKMTAHNSWSAMDVNSDITEIVSTRRPKSIRFTTGIVHGV